MKSPKKRTSIAMQFSVFAVGILLFQAVLLCCLLIGGGVLRQSRDNAYASFHDKVRTRAAYIQSELDHRWTNLDPYVSQVSAVLSQAGLHAQSSQEDYHQVLSESAEILIAMLRASGTTESFLILNNGERNEGNHSALYFRDYDPLSSYDGNCDLYLALGPSSIAQTLRIPMDSTWSYTFQPNSENRSFYQVPYEASTQSQDYKRLGYWSAPFRLTPTDEPIITYSLPLFDQKGQVQGVMGIGISVEHFSHILPASELSSRDSLGYFIALSDRTGLHPIVLTGEYQSRLLKNLSSLDLKEISKDDHLYEMLSPNGIKIYGSAESLNLYHHNTPYGNEQWVVVGLMDGDKLLSFVNTLQRVLGLSFLVSLLVCAVASYLISRRLTRPIIDLAQLVERHDFTQKIQLEKTGLSELDVLSSAIESSNQNLIEATGMMSQIIGLVDFSMGAFESCANKPKAMLTEQVFSILNFPREKSESLYVDRAHFKARLDEILARPEPQEESTYLACEVPERWVRIKLSYRGADCLGIISDVTEEIQEKQRLRFALEFDPLTNLYNVPTFQQRVEALLATGTLKTAALGMFDLDYLKRVNDTYGHECGDRLIQETATRLSNIAPERTVVCRRSGDEFYVFFYHYDGQEELRRDVQMLYDDLQACPFFLPAGKTLQIQMSSGLSWFQKDATVYTELLRHADFAMYEIKHSIKGKMGEFDASRYSQAETDPFHSHG